MNQNDPYSLLFYHQRMTKSDGRLLWARNYSFSVSSNSLKIRLYSSVQLLGSINP